MTHYMYDIIATDCISGKRDYVYSVLASSPADALACEYDDLMRCGFSKAKAVRHPIDDEPEVFYE